MHLLAARSVAAVGVVSLGAVLIPWFGPSDYLNEEIPQAPVYTTAVQTTTVQADDSAGSSLRSPSAGSESLGAKQLEAVPEPPASEKRTPPAELTQPPAGKPRTVVRSGRLNLDPNRLIRVHARFGGQVLSIGQHEGDPGNAASQKTRPLQFGDAVKKGQVLAVVWSREVGEKKSELLHALTHAYLADRQLAETRATARGAEGEHRVSEAERLVKASAMAVERIERTLHSWKMSEDEIQQVRDEADRMQVANSVGNPQLERSWSEVKVRAPFDGVVLERNIIVGEVVDNRLDLFKIGDVTTLGVTVDFYEEDLPALESLGPESRRWTIRLKSEPSMSGIAGSFDVIANVVDPHRHTISVIGTLDNSHGLLRAGQFVTAEVCLK